MNIQQDLTIVDIQQKQKSWGAEIIGWHIIGNIWRTCICFPENSMNILHIKLRCSVPYNYSYADIPHVFTCVFYMFITYSACHTHFLNLLLIKNFNLHALLRFDFRQRDTWKKNLINLLTKCWHNLQSIWFILQLQ